MELTSRQEQILQLLADGKSEQQVADTLSISLNTVVRHMTRIREKSCVSTYSSNMELTSRQKQILQLVVNGRSPRQIAASLQISTKTVMKHLVTTRRKYGVSTRAEMIARAVARGDVYVFMGEAEIIDGGVTEVSPSLALMEMT